MKKVNYYEAEFQGLDVFWRMKYLLKLETEW